MNHFNNSPPLTEDLHSALDEEYLGNDSPEMKLSVGTQLGTYTIRKCIGGGGMASVYLADDGQRTVALKVIRKLHTQRARVDLEARLQMRLSHPNIVPVHHFFEADDMLVIVMSYVDGGSLLKRLQSPISLMEATGIFRQICLAVSYAHQQGVVHRDLKPANVLLTSLASDGETIPHVWVSDFGIAKWFGAQDESFDYPNTHTGTVLGTPGYMAPEQLRSSANSDARTDIFALGIILYELCCGVRPFTGQNIFEIAERCLNGQFIHPHQHRPDLPSLWVDLIMRCLKVESDARFQHVDALLYAIDEVERPLPPVDSTRRPLFFSIAAVVLFMALMSVGGVMYRNHLDALQKQRSDKQQATLQKISHRATIDRLVARAHQLKAEHPSHALALWRVVAQLQQHPDGRGYGPDVGRDVMESLARRGGASLALPHDQQVWRVFWSSDGKSLYTLTLYGVLTQWSIEHGTRLRTFDLTKGERILHVEISPDRRFIIISPNMGYLLDHRPNIVFDTTAQRVIGALPISQSLLPRPVMLNDSKTVLLGGLLDVPIRYTLPDLAVDFSIETKGPRKSLVCIASSDGHKHIAALYSDSLLDLYHDNTLHQLRLPSPPTGYCAMVFSDDGQRLAVNAKSGLFFVDWATKAVRHHSHIDGVSLMVDDDLVLSFGETPNVHVFSWPEGKSRGALLGHQGRVYDINVDDVSIYTGSTDRTIGVWERDGLHRQSTLRGHQSWIFDLDLYAHPIDGPQLASAGRDGYARVFRAFKSHKWSRRLPTSVRQSQWSSDGTILYMLTDKEELLQWDVTQRGEVVKIAQIERLASDTKPMYMHIIDRTLMVITTNHVFKYESGQQIAKHRIRSLKTTKGRMLLKQNALITTNGKIWEFELFSAPYSYRYAILSRFVSRLFVSAQERYSFFTSNQERTFVMDNQTNVRWTMNHVNHQPSYLLTTEDERYAAVGFWSDGVELWDLKTKKRVAHFAVGAWSITHLHFSKDGKYLVAGGSKGQIFLWSMAQMKVLKVFKANTADISALMIDVKRGIIASASKDRKVRVFSLTEPDFSLQHTYETQHVVTQLRIDTRTGLLKGMTNHQTMWAWPVHDTSRERLMSQTGRWTNIRMCEHNGELVPVLPWPSADSVFAPPSSCSRSKGL